MVPSRSCQKRHERTPGNKSVCLSTTGRWLPVPELRLIPSVLFDRSMCPWRSCRASFEISEARWIEKKNISSERDMAAIESELHWQNRYTYRLWFYGEIGTLGMISTNFFPLRASGMVEKMFGLAFHLAVETWSRMTLTRRNRFESAWKAGKWQRSSRVSWLYWQNDVNLYHFTQIRGIPIHICYWTSVRSVLGKYWSASFVCKFMDLVNKGHDKYFPNTDRTSKFIV